MAYFYCSEWTGVPKFRLVNSTALFTSICLYTCDSLSFGCFDDDIPCGFLILNNNFLIPTVLLNLARRFAFR